jgi:hypothetical protein
MSAGLHNGNGQEGNVRALLGCAIFLGAACVSLSTEAEDLWGCQVLLCLANPDGPEALSGGRVPSTYPHRAVASGGSPSY